MSLAVKDSLRFHEYIHTSYESAQPSFQRLERVEILNPRLNKWEKGVITDCLVFNFSRNTWSRLYRVRLDRLGKSNNPMILNIFTERVIRPVNRPTDYTEE